MISAGDIYGNVFENTLIDHKVMLPPSVGSGIAVGGRISFIAPAGNYSLEDKVSQLKKKLSDEHTNKISVVVW